MRQVLEWQDTSNPTELVNALKLDVFSGEVFVFTPKGDVVKLPIGSVPLDFAYRVHTDVGHRCVGAKVNGKIVPLDYTLQMVISSILLRLKRVNQVLIGLTL